MKNLCFEAKFFFTREMKCGMKKSPHPGNRDGEILFNLCALCVSAVIHFFRNTEGA
jgi:hypothetical protein